MCPPAAFANSFWSKFMLLSSAAVSFSWCPLLESTSYPLPRVDNGIEARFWLRILTPLLSAFGWFKGASWTPWIRCLFVFLRLKSFMAASKLPESRSEPSSCKFLALPRIWLLLSRSLRLFMAEALSRDWSARLSPRLLSITVSAGFWELNLRLGLRFVRARLCSRNEPISFPRLSRLDRASWSACLDFLSLPLALLVLLEAMSSPMICTALCSS